MDNVQHGKMHELGNPFHGQNYSNSKCDFQTLKAQAARTDFNSNVQQFCRPKSSSFMRETDFIFGAFFNVICGLQKVVWKKRATSKSNIDHIQH